MTSDPPQSSDACPVDHKAREAWLQQARQLQPQSQQQQQQQQQPSSQSAVTSCPAPHTPNSSSPSSSWSQSLSSWIPSWRSSPPSTASYPPQKTTDTLGILDTHREVSSIPRTLSSTAPVCPVNHDDPASSSSTQTKTTAPSPVASHGLGSNHEEETGVDATTGNWVYPSQKQFFEAMKRKGYEAEARDMQTVVPIHNAVNERAWKEILEWEKPYIANTSCDGPRLHSFAGQSKNMTPKARINTLLGYSPPFDRHDWVVDRCGQTVEYVIDFYQGRGGGPSFYLDVRPKLNSWEGIKMRILRGFGAA